MTETQLHACNSIREALEEIEDRQRGYSLKHLQSTLGFILPWLLIGLIICIFLFSCSLAHAQELTASWYSVASLKKEGTWKTSKGVMANGKNFKDDNFTCACRLYPLGSLLRITTPRGGKSITVRNTDRIGRRFAYTRIDLSKSAFLMLAPLEKGIIKVEVEKQ